MANTYTQLYVQFVFTVKGKENLINEKFRDELEKIICGIVSNHKSKTYAIYCNPDHTHVFVGMHPTIITTKNTGLTPLKLPLSGEFSSHGLQITLPLVCAPAEPRGSALKV